MTTIYITAIQLSTTGRTHEHIVNVWWSYDDPLYKAGQKRMTVAQAVEWLETHGNHALVFNPTTRQQSDVTVVRRSVGAPYLRSRPDHTTTDNLLSLPHAA